MATDDVEMLKKTQDFSVKNYWYFGLSRLDTFWPRDISERQDCANTALSDLLHCTNFADFEDLEDI